MLSDRLSIRLPEANSDLINELLKTATDRINLRVGVDNLPSQLESVAVEVVTAMYRRSEMQHEGVDNEKVDVFSVKFVNRLLDEYEDDFALFRRSQEDDEGAKRGVLRFL